MKNTLSRRSLKAKARRTLSGNYGFLALITVLINAANLIFSAALGDLFDSGSGIWNALLQLAAALVVNIFYYLLVAGQTRIYMKLCIDQSCSFRDLIFAFSNQPEQIALFAVIMYVLETVELYGISLFIRQILYGSSTTVLFLLLAVYLISLVVFCWIQLSLSLVLYLYNESPERSMTELLHESWSLMKGMRIRLFLLNLSFLGMKLLGLLSFGIGLLFVAPYQQMTLAYFYRNLRDSLKTTQNDSF